ncbi:hypothetical protein PAERUG_E5_London_17_VIM_2_12_12_00874 [Pseudomonas aeruginosa]|nr:hypothetical protein PAERUG_E5_London_17_VIM_2_12_12_00874 [Pseudomonas aeruginosa]
MRTCSRVWLNGATTSRTRSVRSPSSTGSSRPSRMKARNWSRIASMSSMSRIMSSTISRSLSGSNSSDRRRRVSGVRRSWETPANINSRSRPPCSMSSAIWLKARYTSAISLGVSGPSGRRTLRPWPNWRAATTRRLSGWLSWRTKIQAAAVESRPMPRNQPSTLQIRWPRKGCGYSGTASQPSPRLGARTQSCDGWWIRRRVSVSGPSSICICRWKISVYGQCCSPGWSALLGTQRRPEALAMAARDSSSAAQNARMVSAAPWLYWRSTITSSFISR